MKKILFFLFSFFVMVSAIAQQEISVIGNNIDITNGDSSPSTTDGTDFSTLGITTQLKTLIYSKKITDSFLYEIFFFLLFNRTCIFK